ncbi:MAG: diguanylate cyclase, partial [Gammaproteobacteria bacterium]
MSVIKNPIAEEIKTLERVSQNCPDAIIRIAEDGNILYANPAGEPLLHCWNHEVGQRVSDDWQQLIADTFESGKPRQTEIDCGKKVFSFYIVPFLDDRCVIVYGKDITERQRTNRELRQNEERFELVLRGTNDGIWDFDLRNGEIHFSPRWKEMLGYEEHEIANHFKAWQDLIHPDDLGQVLEIWANCMGGLKDSFALEYRMRTKSGEWMWVQCRGLALQDSNHTPIRLAGSHTDISERKHAQEALFREKELAQVTLHSIGDAVVTTDTEGNIDYMNPVAEQLAGWQLEEAKGLPSSEVLHLISEISGEAVDEPMKRCMGADRNTDMDGHIVLINRDGTEFTIKDSIAPIRDRDENTVGVVMVFDNVSEERKLQSQLTWQKAHDGLTGLYNRREFERRLTPVLEKSSQENSEHALLYLDLDQFRLINDTCGHLAGDVLLKHLATIVRDNVRDADIVARLGGDEFGVLLQRCPIEQAKAIANALRQSIKAFHFAWEGKTFQIGASVGVVPINADSGSLAEVLTAADMACYKAKDLGRNRICVYEAGDADILRRFSEMQWVTRITDALKSGRFRLYYQAMAPYSPDEPSGEHYEIFLRMLDEDGKIIAPKDFLPAAERYNLMPAIDRWVVGATLTALGTQPHAMDNLATCSINLSGDSL